jgi:hypothetical protein
VQNLIVGKGKYEDNAFGRLSYSNILFDYPLKRVTSAGFKPAISGTGILHSIQLNYEAFIFMLAKVYKKNGICKCVVSIFYYLCSVLLIV